MLSYFHSPTSSKIPFLWRYCLSILCPTIRFIHCAKNIYQVHGTGSSLPLSSGYHNLSIHRRLADSGCLSSQGRSRHCICSSDFDRTGIKNQQRKISPSTNTDPRLHWCTTRLCKSKSVSSTRAHQQSETWHSSLSSIHQSICTPQSACLGLDGMNYIHSPSYETKDVGLTGLVSVSKLFRSWQSSWNGGHSFWIF